MNVNDDLSLPADVDGLSLPWDPSPAAGVSRKRIERNGDEVARLTSIVRYDPGCSFPAHTHGGGEEYLVLQGTFSDETGDHPKGTYVRNGVGTAHAPFTREGCIILVKLWWMNPAETDVIKVMPEQWVGERVLHDTHELVHLVRLHAGDSRPLDFSDGVEVFVVDGDLQLDEMSHQRWGWSRRPGAGTLSLRSDAGATLYVKRGHLTSARLRP